jgi:alkylation response protein AidB-like acyl-CoA dehydrogenase
METTAVASTLKGGEWLIKPGNMNDIFTPEDFNEEQIMIRDMCHQFLQTEVLPVMDRIDRAEPGLMPALMDKDGAKGLFSASVP